MSLEKKIAGLPVEFGKNTIKVVEGESPESLMKETSDGEGGGQSARPEFASFKASVDMGKTEKGSAYKTTGYTAKAE